MTQYELLDLVKALFDDRDTMFGADNSILWLLDRGHTAEEVEQLGYDKEDIQRVIRQNDL